MPREVFHWRDGVVKGDDVSPRGRQHQSVRSNRSRRKRRDRIGRKLGAQCILDIENHHNFAWKETHGGRETVVHRKGATPAGPGVLGVIPGSMASPGYVVRGKGQPQSLNSASHGAGREMCPAGGRTED